MAMTLDRGKFTQHRKRLAALDTGAVASVAGAAAQAIRTLGYETVWVAADLGTVTDVTLTPYLYDEESGKFFAQADIVLDDLEVNEVATRGMPVFFYLKAKTGSFGTVDLYVGPGLASARGA
jgi:hypothetical protein